MTTDNQEREESSHEFDAFRSALNRELALRRVNHLC